MQKDYWTMSEEKLTKLAEKYHVTTHSIHENDEWAQPFFDRNRIISTLVARDTARRASWTLLIAILAIVLSLASFGVSFAMLGLKYRETHNAQPSQTVPNVPR